MSARHTPNANVWWCDSYGSGLVGYVGRGTDGLECCRHDYLCSPGLWRVGVTGWVHTVGHAVVDDFGNLVQVTPR